MIGGGVAGLSAASFLALNNCEAVVVDRRKKGSKGKLPKVGESLPPDARKLLNQLGIWQEFQEGPHLPCFGNISYWGSERAQIHDYMQHPLGHGWHLDRRVFENLLEKRAIELGGKIRYEISLQNVNRTKNSWRVDLDERPEEFDFVIDASGRQSSFAKSQGVQRLSEESQVALVAFLEADEALASGMNLVESGPNGWWYSASIFGRRLSTVFMCDPNLQPLERWCDSEGWMELIGETSHTSKRIREGGFFLVGRPRFVRADSGILEKMSGSSWLAVGDAAMSYDPIAAHGITMAMVSARDAALAIVAKVAGDSAAMTRYDLKLRESYDEYSKRRRTLYDQISKK